ncbi:MAG TPA: RNA polymerase sigma factor [Anaeromyxobacteraceae bacterium]|nr:RNA polymerase sigma factor [Anaeromyxobacteraceae bacterium]
MDEPSDTVLVARAREGDDAAMEALARRYLRPAYAVALAVVRDVSEAEDVAQESLMASLQRLDRCRDPAKFAPWLFAGVRNRALNRLGRSKVRAAYARGEPREELTAGASEGVLLRSRLLSALSRLSSVQREVVLLHDLEEWTHGEVAAALGLSEVMSRQHLFVARRLMRENLGQEHREEEPADE